MRIVLSALAVALVAFCVWLGVRIFNRRERWAKWTAVAILAEAPVIYLLSFGPACWWFTTPDSAQGSIVAPLDANIDFDLPLPCAPRLYWLIGWLAEHGPSPISSTIRRYATLRVPYVVVPTNLAGDSWLIM